MSDRPGVAVQRAYVRVLTLNDRHLTFGLFDQLRRAKPPEGAELWGIVDRYYARSSPTPDERFVVYEHEGELARYSLDDEPSRELAEQLVARLPQLFVGR